MEAVKTGKLVKLGIALILFFSLEVKAEQCELSFVHKKHATLSDGVVNSTFEGECQNNLPHGTGVIVHSFNLSGDKIKEECAWELGRKIKRCLVERYNKRLNASKITVIQYTADSSIIMEGFVIDNEKPVQDSNIEWIETKRPFDCKSMMFDGYCINEEH